VDITISDEKYKYPLQKYPVLSDTAYHKYFINAMIIANIGKVGEIRRNDVAVVM